MEENETLTNQKARELKQATAAALGSVAGSLGSFPFSVDPEERQLRSLVEFFYQAISLRNQGLAYASIKQDNIFLNSSTDIIKKVWNELGEWLAREENEQRF